MANKRPRGNSSGKWHVLRRCMRIVERLLYADATTAELEDIVSEGVDVPQGALERRFEEDRKRLRELLNCTLIYDWGRQKYTLADAGVFERLRRIVRVGHPPSNIQEARVKGYELALRDDLDWWARGVYLPEVLNIPQVDERYPAYRKAFRRGWEDAGGQLRLANNGRIYPAKRCPNCKRILPLEDFFSRPNGQPTGYCRICHGDPLLGRQLPAYRSVWQQRRHRTGPGREQFKAAQRKYALKRPPTNWEAIYARKKRGLITLRGAAGRARLPEYLIQREIDKGYLSASEEDGKIVLSRTAFEAWLNTERAQRLIQAVAKAEGRA